MKKIWILSMLLLFACSEDEKKPEEKKPEPTPTVVVVDPPAQANEWKIPKAGWKFQIMDEEHGDYLKQLKSDTNLVNVELFGVKKEQIEKLHAKNVYVVCYYSMSYEEWRPDSKQFPKETLGKKMSGWNERWTDLSKESLHVFMDKRDLMAKKLGCNGVENDNIDDGEDAFGLSKSQLSASNKRRADHAHNLGLGHFAKNTPDLSAEFSKQSDGVFVEEARRYDEVDDYKPWIGKFVAMVEYSKSKAKCVPWATVNYHSSGYFTGDYRKCD